MIDFSKISVLLPINQQEEISQFIENFENYDYLTYNVFEKQYPDLLTEAEFLSLFLQVKHKNNTNQPKDIQNESFNTIVHSKPEYKQECNRTGQEIMQEVINIEGQIATELNKTLKNYLQNNTMSEAFKVVDTANHLKMLKEFACIAESLTKGLTVKHPSVLAVQVNNNNTKIENDVKVIENAKDLSKLLLKVAQNSNGLEVMQEVFANKDPYEVIEENNQQTDIQLLRANLNNLK